MVNLLRRWAPLDAVAELGAPRMGVVGEGVQGIWLGDRGGGEKVSTMLVSIGTLG
jgi:hypothetical protein